MNFFPRVVLLIVLSTCSAEVVQIGSNNWTQTFEGEWLVEFYAPWCPACRQFGPILEEISNDQHVTARIAAVDVTENPVLSFVFFVYRLPSIFYAKDGLFREYDGPRMKDNVYDYLVKREYLSQTPIPWYYSPSSFHMGLFFRFMELGMVITHIHQYLLDTGFPTWLSFITIGLATILFGTLLGSVLVIIFDCFFPPRPQILRLFSRKKKVSNGPAYNLNEKREDESPIDAELPVDGSGESNDVQDQDLRRRAVAQPSTE
ncbi:unnamed protein product [Calicophoron daubneyi]|uniref:Thioredoxin domain-containing protein n=1 Tax=Calicophoron daubneyi TaxID=300641 RepID=A0AAV2TGY2_CALDB